MSIWRSIQSNLNKQTADSENVDESIIEHVTKVDLQGLIQLRFQSAHLSLGSQKKAYSSLAGNYSSAFKGRGLNFDEVRPYQPGDDIRNIDWNVTARTDKVHTKIFKEERERPVFIVVDLSNSMFFGSKRCFKSVTAAKAAALFAWAGADNHNRIGGLIFNEYEHREMRPKGGHQGVLRFLKMLSDFHNDQLDKQASSDTTSPTQQESDESRTPLNIDLLFSRIQKLIHTGSIVLLASDFKQMNEGTLKPIRYIARHNDLLITHIYDVLEKQLPPPGEYAVSNGTQYHLLDTNDESLRESFESQFENKTHELEQFCIQNQIHLINLATHEKCEDIFLATLGKDSSVRRIARSRH